MRIDDIDGTKTKVRHNPRANSNGFSAFDYSDVTKQNKISKRCVNPLDPVYTMTDENGNKYEVGKVDGAQPARMPSPPNPDRAARVSSLQTADIAGA